LTFRWRETQGARQRTAAERVAFFGAARAFSRDGGGSLRPTSALWQLLFLHNHAARQFDVPSGLEAFFGFAEKIQKQGTTMSEGFERR